MRITQLNTFDLGGGAERIAMTLLRGYAAAGHEARLAVNTKRSGNPDVIELIEPPPRNPWAGLLGMAASLLRRQNGVVKGAGYLARELERLRQPAHWLRRQLGREDYRFMAAGDWFDNLAAVPDVLHLHNLHGGNLALWERYFDLRLLPVWSRRLPVVLTLHDAWPLSGHCAHSFDCQRWLTGCGKCPALGIYPAVKMDATAHNWRFKAALFKASSLFISAPSRWLMDKALVSILAPAIQEWRVIPNGVDLDVFSPADQMAARKALDLPPNDFILLFAANALDPKSWKDSTMARAVLARFAERFQNQPITLLAMGGSIGEEQFGHAQLRYLPFSTEPARVARCYQACDAYFHPARADTFPTAVIEALACARPVFATAVGGIPEQVIADETGFLAQVGDSEDLAGKLEHYAKNVDQRDAMQRRCRRDAELRFDERQMIGAYLEWFSEILTMRAAKGQ